MCTWLACKSLYRPHQSNLEFRVQTWPAEACISTQSWKRTRSGWCPSTQYSQSLPCTCPNLLLQSHSMWSKVLSTKCKRLQPWDRDRSKMSQWRAKSFWYLRLASCDSRLSRRIKTDLLQGPVRHRRLCLGMQRQRGCCRRARIVSMTRLCARASDRCGCSTLRALRCLGWLLAKRRRVVSILTPWQGRRERNDSISEAQMPSKSLESFLHHRPHPFWGIRTQMSS